ncbi:MAG TPA: hypothetical protein VK034_21550, partial [Enhygromyxa sp.]|nr:hypothetical protein [Enhygromyxa sp.]
MIIACPECTNPFEIADGHIAPLVQIECPTCNFRMILDFEAANDASLREEGMGMAQGFRDAASYRQAVGAGQIGYSPSTSPAQPAAERPSLRAVPDQPAPQPVAQPPIRQPRVEPPVEKPPIRQPVAQPVAEQPVAEQPVAEQPVVAQPVAEQPVLDKPPVRHPPATPQP